jgi:hypothetical protein
MDTIDRRNVNFYKCPGAWYGSMPDIEHPNGNITVDCNYIMPALKFLGKHYNIIKTREGNHHWQSEHNGITIVFERKN